MAFMMSNTLTRRRVDSATRLSSLAGSSALNNFLPLRIVWIVLNCRCDDNAKVKEKMIYASSKDELKKRLVGIATEVQANDKSGFDMKEVVERVVKV
jgi:hypothetical protein